MIHRLNGKGFSFIFPITQLIILLLLLLFLNCVKEKDQELAYPLKTAELVSHATSGRISSTGDIRVRFVSPVIQENLVGQQLKKEVFSFEPPIEGTARWESTQVLVFKPAHPLPLRQKFNGTLDLAALLPLHKEKLEPLNFSFEVSGREIQSVCLDLKLKEETDPRLVYYRGEITFTETVEQKAVERAATLKLGKKSLALQWQQSGKGNRFTLTSEPFERGDLPQKAILLIPKKGLDISEDYRQEFLVPALEELAVLSVIPEQREEQPGLRIEFSDELDPRLELAGLIRVEPPVDLKLKKVGKYVFATGNFTLGETYRLIISSGIRSRLANTLKTEYNEEVKFEDINPQIRFASEGVFLPSANEQKIVFQTINVSRVHLEIIKVFESNLGQFLQWERLNSSATRREGFRYADRVGITVHKSDLEIGEVKNKWLQNELDLSNILEPGEKGLFLLSLNITEKDILYGTKEEAETYRSRRRRYYGRDYYSSPYSAGYYYQHGRIYKPVILSDIGLTYKQAHKSHIIYATDIINARPVAGVMITLRTYQNQVIAQKTTGRDGKAEFTNIDEKVFYVEGEKDGQRSVIKLNEMSWNLSTFDTGGEAVKPGGTRAFIYTERGVYRPGDEINLCVIARNQDHTFPDNLPVTLKIYNPRNQTVFETTNRESRDGFYRFTFQTKPEDPTGNWRAEIEIGGKKFYHTLKIETVVPFRLKVKLQPEKERLTRDDKTLNLKLESTYLFGNPAANLNTEVEAVLHSVRKKFKRYSDFLFDNQTISFKPVTKMIFKGRLNPAGRATIRWNLPSLEKAPSALQADITAKVFEKGGRPNKGFVSLPIDPYPYYVGLRRPEMKYGYARVGDSLTVSTILVDTNGEAAAGRSLKYRIYKNKRYWWWEYDSYREYQFRYKSDAYTELLKEGTIQSATIPVEIGFVPDEDGRFLVEVSDGTGKGHVAAIFIYASHWGGGVAGAKNAGVLTLNTDRKTYYPGDKAVVSFPVPVQGSVLYSLEKGSDILETRWLHPEKGQEVMKIEVPVTENMVPTAYAAISIIQPHNQTVNDRPIRMYGVVPLNIEDPQTHHEVEIIMPEELKSDKPFRVKLQTSDRKPTQFTIAVVDEGLLALTHFKTPDPWAAFFGKQRLGVKTYDLFNFVIGVNRGDIFKTFSIGGGIAEGEAYRETQLEPRKAKRFKPVSMFKGPFFTDSDGQAEVEFEMPEYIGAVRVMVVSAHGKSYANAEKTVPVKTDLMVMPSLPRVLGPGDKISLPVTVFAMREGMGQVEVSIKTEGPLTLTGTAKKTISFTTTGEKDVYFQLQANEAIGVGKIEINAHDGNYRARYETEIDVRASSPRISAVVKAEAEPGQKVKLTIPTRGLPGSNEARISVQRLPHMDFTHRLYYLIRYPYGCIEQVVSSVFPQLYLKTLLKDSRKPRETEREIDRNINFAIRRLRNFQLSSGAFTYWPGNREPSPWGTNYACHFLVEAQKLGYTVPGDLMQKWLRYQRSQALSTRENLMVRVYRVYILALAGKPHLGAMNLLKQNSMKDMTDTEKWMLAGAYQLAGAEDVASDILKNTGMDVRDYFEFGRTYGSTLRDKAIILEQLILFRKWDKANDLAGELAETLSSDTWYSTQTLGYMLLAVGKYYQALEGESKEPPLLKGYVELPGGEKIEFETGELSYNLDITECFGKEAAIFIDKKSNLKRAFISLTWSGQPLRSDVKDESKNLILKVEWLDEDGIPISPLSLVQGTTFWAHFRVEKAPSFSRQAIEEVALVQILPAGWEVENIRLSGEARPTWMSRWRLNREEYQDIRDDRVMWFFDFPPRRDAFDFVVKLNAVTVGTFSLPPTLVEAMYNTRYKASKAGGTVDVTAR